MFMFVSRLRKCAAVTDTFAAITLLLALVQD